MIPDTVTYDFADAGLARLLQIDPDTLRRMAAALDAAEDWEFAQACWAALSAHEKLATMPGDELWRLLAAAERNGQRILSRRLNVEINLRLANIEREPLFGRS